MSGTTCRATNRLRFIVREGKRILQQGWVCVIEDEYTGRRLKGWEEWRDVPLESEPTP